MRVGVDDVVGLATMFTTERTMLTTTTKTEMRGPSVFFAAATDKPPAAVKTLSAAVSIRGQGARIKTPTARPHNALSLSYVVVGVLGHKPYRKDERTKGGGGNRVYKKRVDVREHR